MKPPVIRELHKREIWYEVPQSRIADEPLREVVGASPSAKVQVLSGRPGKTAVNRNCACVIVMVSETEDHSPPERGGLMQAPVQVRR